MSSKLGFYYIGDKIFQNKIQAILYANQKLENIEWNFNRDILDNIDWTIEPQSSLSELYARRAKQIREDNDYVILMISGAPIVQIWRIHSSIMI